MRLPDWERRLRIVLADWRQVECSRARHCGDLAADVIEAVTGRDIRPQMQAHSPAELAALYRRHNARNLAQVVTAILGEPVGPRRASRGDIVHAIADPALGVCLGERAAVLHNGGLQMLPMHAVALAWKL